MSRERIRPMPTEEEKARARLKMASADPFAWAMKSVDDRFPDSREKDTKTLKEEAEVEAMVRKIMAKKRMAQKMAAEMAAKQSVETTPKVVSEPKAVSEQRVVSEAKVVPEPVETKKTEIVAERETKEIKPEVATEKSDTEKAIEEAFEGDETATEEDFDDEYYYSDDDIEKMEKDLYDDLGDEDDSKPVDGGIMDEDMMKTEILDEDLLDDELRASEPKDAEPEIMDDFDDEEDVAGDDIVDSETVKEQVTEAPADETTKNERPVNMVLGKKTEESEETEKPVEAVEDADITVEVTPMDQDMKDKIRAKQMNFEVEGSTKNPLIDDGKPVPEIEKTEPVNTPKAQVKLMGMESSQKKMMVGIIARAVLAIGGILFGVVAMINQGKASEELAQQMAVVTSTTSSSSKDMDDEYIYVKDWGMKIKIIAGLTDVSYNVANDDLAEVLVWGAKKDNSISYTPDFARQAKNSNPLGTVVRVARYERAAAGRLIWYDDYYNYYYQGPTGIPAVSEDEMNWWVESYLLIKEMLTNADNYTAIDDTTTIGQQQ